MNLPDRRRVRMLAMLLTLSLPCATGQAQTRVIAWGSTGQPSSNLTDLVAITRNIGLKSDRTIVDLFTGSATGPANAIAIASGEAHNLALITDGTIVAWGENRFGDTDVPAGLTNVVAVSASDMHSLALKSDGTVVAWGYGWDAPFRGVTCLSNIVAISANINSSLALRSDGRVFSFSTNGCAELSGISDSIAVANGQTHLLILRVDGTVTELGNYLPLDLPAVPAKPPIGLSNVIAVAAGSLHSIALKADGTVVGWGLNYSGQAKVPAGLANVVAITAGDASSLALSAGQLTNLHQRLLGFALDDAREFRCSITTQIGRVYRLESKHSLTDPNWVSGSLVAGTGGEVTFKDFVRTDSQRFYRVRRW